MTERSNKIWEAAERAARRMGFRGDSVIADAFAAGAHWADEHPQEVTVTAADLLVDRGGGDSKY